MEQSINFNTMDKKKPEVDLSTLENKPLDEKYLYTRGKNEFDFELPSSGNTSNI